MTEAGDRGAAAGARIDAYVAAYLVARAAAVCRRGPAQAIEPLPFADHVEELRFQHLTAQLRCPMCQNETLADSNAPIARDLRNQIFS
jgi:cytochrome c-type biogenesis protein CcmH/NrfF